MYMKLVEYAKAVDFYLEECTSGVELVQKVRRPKIETAGGRRLHREKVGLKFWCLLFRWCRNRESFPFARFVLESATKGTHQPTH